MENSQQPNNNIVNTAAKSILKSPTASQEELNEQKKNRLRWDEDNIQITGQDRGTRMKILEPKTPYIHYTEDTDEYLSSSQISQQALDCSVDYIPPIDLNAALEQLDPEELAAKLRHSDSLTSYEQLRRNSYDWDSSDDQISDPAKKTQFANRRLRHYDMREALRMGRKLAEQATADDDEDDDDEMQDFDTNLSVPVINVVASAPTSQPKTASHAPVVAAPAVLKKSRSEEHPERTGALAESGLRNRSVSFSASDDMLAGTEGDEHMLDSDLYEDELNDKHRRSASRTSTSSTGSLKSALRSSTSAESISSKQNLARSQSMEGSEHTIPSNSADSLSKKHVRIVDSRTKFQMEMDETS